MKIAILVSTFPPYHGGMGNVAADQARELARLGHEVTVYTPAPHRPHPPTGDEPYRVRHVRPVFRWGNAAVLPGILRELRGQDAIMLHYPFFGTAEFFLDKKLKQKIGRLILVYHMDVVGRGMLGRFFAWHTKAILPHILHHSDVIAVSSLDYALSGVLGTMPENIRKKLVEFPIGVDTARFSPGNKEEARNHFSIPADSRVALFVGGLDRAHYFKGVPVLLDAFSKFHIPHSTFQLLIAGSGDLREQYEARARGLDIADRVRFLGRVPDDDLPNLYRAADVVILPSVDRSEAFGKVLLEAQACGVPVITSNLPGVRTAIKDGVTGLLAPPNDPTALADAIRSVLEDPARAASMGLAARSWVEEKYSWRALGPLLSRLVD